MFHSAVIGLRNITVNKVESLTSRSFVKRNYD